MDLPDFAEAAPVEGDPLPIWRPGRVAGDVARQPVNRATVCAGNVESVGAVARSVVSTKGDPVPARCEGRIPLRPREFREQPAPAAAVWMRDIASHHTRRRCSPGSAW